MYEAMFGHKRDESDNVRGRTNLDTYTFVQHEGFMVRANAPEVAGLDLLVLTSSSEVVRQVMLNMLEAPMSWDRPDDAGDSAAVKNEERDKKSTGSGAEEEAEEEEE
jgi:hypothetical protein